MRFWTGKIVVFFLLLFSFSVFAANDEQPSASDNQAAATLQQKLQQLQQLSDQAQTGAASTLPSGQQQAPATTTAAQPATSATPAASTATSAAQPAATASAAPTQAAAATTQTEANMSNRAFAGVVSRQLPMTPTQIEALHTLFNAAQKAAAEPIETPARPSTSAINIDLSPNATPPVVRLGAGYISSLVFMDATGQPWPIQAYSVGDPTSFNIQWDQKSNTLLVQADTFYKRSNLAVLLKDLDTPIMLTLLPGQTAVDYRIDLRVPGLGPNAIFVRNDLPNSADPVLLDVLNGVPPKKARTLQVVGCDNCQAWLMNNELYIRTNLEIISPAWNSIMTSTDGTHAYQLQPTSVVLALEKGKDKVVKLVLQGIG